MPFKQLFVETREFQEIGDVHYGTVESLGVTTMGDKEVEHISMISSEGEPFKILCGTFVLNKLYHSEELKPGVALAIKFEGEAEGTGRKGNKLKKFSYMLAPKVEDIEKELNKDTQKSKGQ